MAILIDGYNLLHGTDLFGSGSLSGTLQGSREALVRFVQAAVDERELARTTIVFDSKESPPGLLDFYHVSGGLTVRFARDYADADELLEELIQREHAPKKLTVVSSDHRVQRAAHRRKALVVESHAWFLAMCAALSSGHGGGDAKSVGPLPAAVVEEWNRDVQAMLAAEQNAMQPPQGTECSIEPDPEQPQDVAERPDKAGKRRIRGKRRKDSPEHSKEIDFYNPFPPGYAEDLLRGEEDV